MKGTVKWFDFKKGYGFVTGEDGTDYFAHQSNIQMEGFRKLNKDQAVSFNAAYDSQGRTVANMIIPE